MIQAIFRTPMKWSNAVGLISTTLLILALVWWQKGDNSSTDLNQYKAIIEQLKAQNDSLKNDNRLLDEKIKKSQLEADSLQQLVAVKIIRIRKLKNIRNEKIKTIDAFSNDKLYQFFAGINTDSSAVER